MCILHIPKIVTNSTPVAIMKYLYSSFIFSYSISQPQFFTWKRLLAINITIPVITISWFACSWWLITKSYRGYHQGQSRMMQSRNTFLCVLLFLHFDLERMKLGNKVYPPYRAWLFYKVTTLKLFLDILYFRHSPQLLWWMLSHKLRGTTVSWIWYTYSNEKHLCYRMGYFKTLLGFLKQWFEYKLTGI